MGGGVSSGGEGASGFFLRGRSGGRGAGRPDLAEGVVVGGEEDAAAEAVALAEEGGADMEEEKTGPGANRPNRASFFEVIRL